MNAPTHAAFGILFALVVILLGRVEPMHGFLTLVLLASVLPDLDHHNSTIGRKFPMFSRVFEFFFGKRGIYHSMLGCAVTLFLAYLIMILFGIAGYKTLLLALFIGFFSHLILDSTTVTGVKWLQPLSKFKIKGLFKTGGFFEKALLLALILSIGAVLGVLGLSIIQYV